MSKIFVITKNHQQYRDFIRIHKLNPNLFIYPNNRKKFMGQRGFLYIEYGELPDDYHEIYVRYILPYEAVKIKGLEYVK